MENLTSEDGFETTEELIRAYGREYINSFGFQYEGKGYLPPRVNWAAVHALKGKSRVLELAAFLAETIKICICPWDFKFEEHHELLRELYPEGMSLLW